MSLAEYLDERGAGECLDLLLDAGIERVQDLLACTPADLASLGIHPAYQTLILGHASELSLIHI